MNKIKVFIRLDPSNTWDKRCEYCPTLLNARGFKATHFKGGLAGEILREEYLCNSHAKKLYPYYFSKLGAK